MSLRSAVARTGAVVGIAVAQLRRSPGRTALTVLAVTLAVLAVTLLASLGVGVAETGEDGLEAADRDIWLSGDPTGTDASNPIVGANGLSAELGEREDVGSATPIAIHDVYVGTDPESTERIAAVGVHSTHDGFEFEAGSGFETDVDVDEPPDEPVVGEIVLDPAVADDHGVGVGDTVAVGAGPDPDATATFTVVGISSHHSQFLGSAAATVPLSDLQVVSGTTGSDRATFVVADAAEGADAATVRDDLDDAYPEYDVRTSDEQVGAMAADRPLVVASGLTLVGLAVVGGVVLTGNLFAIAAYQQRDQLAALRAIGLSRRLLAGTIGTQGLVVGMVGGLAGLLLTSPAVRALNRLVAAVVGFEELLRTPLEVYVVGFAVAVVVGTVVAVASGWRAGRYARIEHLQR